jgi:glucose/mannose transport system substrate-binding protein
MLSKIRFCFPLFLLFQTTATPVDAAPKAALEIFSYWTSGSEAAALKALLDLCKEQNPGVEIVNATVAGGNGSAALPVLQARLLGGNPPDTWQTHPGSELFNRYVTAGKCEPVTQLYASEAWSKVVPAQLVHLMSRNGETYCVLAGVHRANVLWYNKKVLAKQGITIGDTLTFQEFLAAANKLLTAGITPLAVGDSGIWTSTCLLENCLLANLHASGWNDLCNNKIPWNDPRVLAAVRWYKQLLDFENPNHAALSWDQAIASVIEGKCAFSVMGDWAYGEFKKASQKDNEDFGWANFPETEGSFDMVGDGFTLATGAPHRNEALQWLKILGSKEGQLAFNKIKGSIPVRTDIDSKEFGPYHQWSMNSFAHDSIVPSVFEGEATTPAFQQALNDAVSTFSGDKNVDRLVKTMVAAAAESSSSD